MNSREIPFRPKLEGEFRNRFYSAVSPINNSMSIIELVALCDKEIDWVENKCGFNIEQRKRYRAVWFLLRDLLRSSWKAEFKEGILLMRLPSISQGLLINDSPIAIKALLRSWMQESRHERLVSFSDFINRMEKSSATKKDISNLIADGNELANRMHKVLNGEIDITEAVQPYLQLVTDAGEESVDQFTGQKVSDIWRYFRMTWSTPIENTPGRTMQYLVRDAAQKMHPVMGIASLENSAVAITCRDNYIGWTTKAFIEQISSGKRGVHEAFEKLIEYLNEGIQFIDVTGLCSHDEIDNPNDNLVQRLSSIAKEADNERRNILVRQYNSKSSKIAGISDTSRISEELLFRRKRAERLAKFISAKTMILSVISETEFENKWQELCETETLSTAIRIALSAQKSKHIGSSILELNICGAIPPYNEILGGKLVALLATSPQVIADYRKRYSGRISEIASKVKGEDVCRPAELVYIGTTSLYSIGSSQYNRLKIPQSVLGSTYDLEWKKLGYTTGFGTLHISRATTISLKEATNDGNNKVNHVFGEGPSPKLRLLSTSIRELLESNSEDTKEFTKHAMSRIVYGINLAQNSSDYLLGYTNKPIYYADSDDYSIGTRKIIKYWQIRWLKKRLSYSPIFERIRNFKKKDLYISQEILQSEEWSFTKLTEVTTMPSNSNHVGGLDFIRDFYLGKSSFADKVQGHLLT